MAVARAWLDCAPPAGKHDVGTFRNGISKHKLQLSDLVARKLCPGEIIPLHVHLDPELLTQSLHPLKGCWCSRQIDTRWVWDFWI